MFGAKKVRKFGFLNGAAAACSYGLNPLFSLPLFALGFSVNSVLFYRYAIAVVIYKILLMFKGDIDYRVSRKEINCLLYLGIMFTLSSVTLFTSFNYIASGVACTILFVYPVIVACIMAIFFKEKVTKTTVISVVVALTGIFLLNSSFDKNAISKVGLFYILLSALSYALYMVGIRTIKTVKKMHSDKITFYVMCVSVLFYYVMLNFGVDLQPVSGIKEWVCVLGLAIVPTIISLETINIAIKIIGATKTAILGALEPLTAVLIGTLIFKEQFSLSIGVGIICVLSGVTLTVLKK